MTRLPTLLYFAFASVLAAQGHNIRNADVRVVTPGGGLGEAVRTIVSSQTSPAWIAWVTPRSPGDASSCADQRGLALEGASTLQVLLRVEDGKIARIRGYSGECPVDAGGLRVFVLGAVPAADSVRFLSGLTADSDALRRQSLPALAFHAGDEAVDELIRLARHDQTTRVRSQALFWLAQRAGRKAAAAVQDAIEDDPDTGVKKQAVFALSQLPRDEGIPLLIRVARTNRNPAVRKQALFWLGQSNDARALQFIEEILKP